MKIYKLYINNQFVEADEGKVFDSINPSNGKIFAQIADGSIKNMEAAIISARESFDKGVWRQLSVQARGAYLIKIAELIRKNAKELAQLETCDVGKTTKQAIFIDIPTCAETFEYFGKISKELDDKINPVAAPVKSVLVREPLGVVACIIPWNYPLIMTAWKMAPALIAGNTVVFKPSSKASVSVMRLAEIISEAGLPQGVVNIVTSTNHEVASQLAKSLLVDKLTFTGGTETGAEVMKMASGNNKRLTLELGGKSPNIVFDDCDFDAAIGGAMTAIFMNQGQMCTAGSRLLVQENIYEKFLESLVKKTKALKIGDASDYETDFGPLVSRAHRDYVLQWIEQGKKEGAKIICGGKTPEGNQNKNGFYVEPTIFSDVTNSMRIAQEEIFGPVLCVMKFSTIEEAIKIANDSKFGLAACVWTKDDNKAQSVARQLQCGTVWINTYGGFYNEAPFGGYKRSGFGRELGVEGLLEYTQTKHICIDQTPGGKPLVSGWF
ncbi:MAG TPA: aldehyde dehydrogenase family protein [Candidatus Omnitrophota bacterium]|nr:aldehyde dehydrogenase family protein [Candidatus Omnitrophota bacterium]